MIIYVRTELPQIISHFPLLESFKQLAFAVLVEDSASQFLDASSQEGPNTISVETLDTEHREYSRGKFLQVSLKKKHALNLCSSKRLYNENIIMSKYIDLQEQVEWY